MLENESSESEPSSRHLLELWEGIVNQVLLSVPSEKRPDSEIVCTVCPKAMWLVNSGALHCWCKATHTMTWKLDDPALRVTSCNGPEEGMTLEG